MTWDEWYALALQRRPDGQLTLDDLAALPPCPGSFADPAAQAAYQRHLDAHGYTDADAGEDAP